MNIVHVVKGKADPNKGNGVGKMVHFLASEQVSIGVCTEVWGIAKGVRDPDLKSVYEYTQFDTIKACIVELFRRKKNRRFQYLFVLHGPFIPEFFLLAECLRRKGMKYVFMPHDQYNSALLSGRFFLKKIYFKLIEKRILCGASAIQVLHSDHAKILRKLGVRNKYIEFPNGISPEEMWTGLESERPDEFTFFYLGRLDVHNKGLDVLIDAFKKTGLSRESRLVLQGNGDLDQIKKIISDRGADRIYVYPPDFNMKSADIIRSGDVFCLVSRFEGFGLVALEAMSAERPVIVSEVAGISDHVIAANCGLSVRPEIDSVATALTWMFENKKLLNSLGEKGRDYVLNNLTSIEIAKKITKKYSEIINQ